MSDEMYDNESADALVAEIGRMIIADPNYAPRDWTAISLVIEVASRKRMYGFVCLGDGVWEAETPHDFAVIEKADELERIMARRDRPWMHCLVHITRPGPEVTIKFGEDEIGDWAITPANHAEMVEKLRPR